MPGNRYLQEISESITAGETVGDVVMMIDILAFRRQRRRREPIEESDGFAATVLCILFAPVKTYGYRLSITAVRLQFVGIAESARLQRTFSESLTETLLTASSAAEAIQMGVRSLFFLNIEPPESESGPLAFS